jgi:hypothetical protein
MIPAVRDGTPPGFKPKDCEFVEVDFPSVIPIISSPRWKPGSISIPVLFSNGMTAAVRRLAAGFCRHDKSSLGMKMRDFNRPRNGH